MGVLVLKVPEVKITLNFLVSTWTVNYARWSDRFVNPNDYDNDNPEKVEGIRTKRISF